MAKYLYLRIKQKVGPGEYDPRIHEPAGWEYIVAEDLGTGSVGAGNKYLADDMTWKSISGGGLSDGDKGDIVVSGTGTILTIDTSAVTDSKIATGITASKITEDSTHRFTTDAEKTTWNGKANASHTHVAADVSDFDTEVSNNTDVAANTTARHTHTNSAILAAITEAFTSALKTAYDSTVSWISTNGTNLINHLSNTLNPHSVTASQVGAYTTGQVDTALGLKQDTLVSATNIKTINGSTILGSGDLAISGGSGLSQQQVEGLI